jgi:hypothetical protein
MATKSKMSTSVTRKVTKKTTPPPVNIMPMAEETEAQYEQRLKNWSNLKSENEGYSQKLADYNTQMKEYKQTGTAKGLTRHYLRPSRDMSQAEIDAFNRRNVAEAKKNKQVYVPITKGSKIEKGISINPKTGDFTGKFGSDPVTGRQYDWSETGSGYGPYTNVVHQKPTAPAKPQPLGRKPLNTKYDPKMKLKKPTGVDVNKSISSPSLAKSKLTTEVPVAIEKPTKKPVPKRAKGGVVVSTVQKHRSLLGKKLFKTDTRTALKVKGVKKPVGVVAGDSSKKRAVKAENRKIGAAQRAFKREEKLATGYLKNQGIFEGENKREIKGAVKSYAKAKRMEPGIMDKTTRQAIKSGKKAVKYVGLSEKNKIKSFTPEALAKKKTVAAKVQTVTSGKGRNKKTTAVAVVPTKQSKRMQAGRYVY